MTARPTPYRSFGRAWCAPGLVMLGAFGSLVAGCGGSGSETPEVGAVGTIALSPMPPPPALAPTIPSPPPLSEIMPSTTQAEPVGDPNRPLREGEFAKTITGNRVLMIGDSILASTAPAADGPMCPSLEASGWAVQIEAKEAMFIDYADEVLDVVTDDFDVVMVNLGNNYRGDYDDFTEQLVDVLERLESVPIVLYTLAEDTRGKAELNGFIRGLPTYFGNVHIIDWAEKATDDALLSPDGLHLSTLGKERLALFTIAMLGQTTAGESACLKSQMPNSSSG